jgi:hypothetical protein
MRERRLGKDEKREVTPEFVNMSKEILYPKFRVLQLMTVNFAEREALALDKPSFCRVSSLTLGKVYFFCNQTFCGLFLNYVDLYVQFWYNYKSV